MSKAIRRFIGLGALCVLSACANGNQGASARPMVEKNPATETLRIELRALRAEFSGDARILYVLSNGTSKDVSATIPEQWDGLVFDWFTAHKDGKRLANPLSETDYDFPLRAVLASGESITTVFMLSTVALLPEEPAQRAGRYEVRLAEGVNLGAVPVRAASGRGTASFRLAAAPRAAALPAIKDMKDAAALRAALASPELEPEAARELLAQAASTLEPGAFWSVAAAAPQAYAVVASLEKGPELDAEALKALLNHRDLSVRRAALKAAARVRNAKASLSVLDRHLSRTKDEPSLEYGRRSAEALRKR